MGPVQQPTAVPAPLSGSDLPADTLQRQAEFKNATIGRHGERGAINPKAEKQPVAGSSGETLDAKLATIEQDAMNLLLKIQALRKPQI